MSDDPHQWPEETIPAVLTGQVPVSYPQCREHHEIQHRDGRPPWCNRCGWTHGAPSIPAQRLGRPNGGWGTPRRNDG